MILLTRKNQPLGLVQIREFSVPGHGDGRCPDRAAAPEVDRGQAAPPAEHALSRMFRCLTNSREGGNRLIAYISLARMEGEEGYTSAKDVLDRDGDDDPTAGIGAFSLGQDITGEQLHRILVQREFPTTP